MARPIPSIYDDYPYPAYCYALSHPDNLAVIATLLGLRPAPPNGSRILELGCAIGGNLLPMAAGLPDSELIGVDVSTRQIETGREASEQLGLSNLRLMAADIAELGPELGTFDYIICHGVFSWVPDEARASILRVLSANLRPRGVAYLSYNVYPGWHEAQMLRDMMRFHMDRTLPPSERVERARQLIDVLLATVPEHDTRRPFLEGERDRLDRLDPTYLFYEYLDEHNRPLYFHQLIDMATAVGLRYLGNAGRVSMFPDNQDDDLAEMLRGCRDMVESQQYLDLFLNRRFRATLLTHAEQAVSLDIEPKALDGMLVRADISPDPGLGDVLSPDPIDVLAKNGRGAAITGPVIRTSLSLLTQIAPCPLRLGDLIAQTGRALTDAGIDASLADLVQDLGAHMLRLYAAGVVEFHRQPVRVTNRITERPRAGRVARWQAARSGFIANQYHHMKEQDPLTRAVIAKLDGTRTLDMLSDELATERPAPAEGGDPIQVMRRSVERVLEALRREAFLVD